MRINEITFTGPPPIDSYFDGGFRIAGALHEGSALLIGAEILSWPVTEPARLDVSMFQPAFERADAFDVLLIGTGDEIAPLPATLREAFEEYGVGADFMATPAACRTYNVLLSEGRRVAAGLIATGRTAR
jgi:uncharacterized protein